MLSQTMLWVPGNPCPKDLAPTCRLSQGRSLPQAGDQAGGQEAPQGPRGGGGGRKLDTQPRNWWAAGHPAPSPQDSPMSSQANLSCESLCSNTTKRYSSGWKSSKGGGEQHKTEGHPNRIRSGVRMACLTTGRRVKFGQVKGKGRLEALP